MKTNSLSLILGVVFLAVAYAAAGVNYPGTFAPQDGLVCRYEIPGRQELCLNGRWRFQGTTNTLLPLAAAVRTGDWDSTPIKIPSPWNVNSFGMNQGISGGDFRAYPSYPAAWENLPAAWMEKMVRVPADWSGRQIVLKLGAIAGEISVFVNSKRATPMGKDELEIFFARDFGVTSLIKLGVENEILVKVVAPSVFNQPGRYGSRVYVAGSFWGSHIAGLWQDVFLVAEPPVAVTDLFVQPWVDRDELVVEATVVNRSQQPAKVELAGDVREWHRTAEPPEVGWRLAEQPSLSLEKGRLNLAPGQTGAVTLRVRVNGRLKLWSPTQPNLYGLLALLSVNGQTVDTKYQRFGWRQFKFEGNKMLLNGQPIVLAGDSWHFLGVPQMTRRYAWAWYKMLQDAGANAVRLHASVYPSFYQDLADEMGMMVLDESAIWLSDGASKGDSDLYWERCRTHVNHLVHRDRNHPSVFGWSVCNEILPVMRNVWNMPQPMVDRGLDEIGKWAEICRQSDPTRAWISGDGEGDANGRLPVINLHYSAFDDEKRARDTGKPWGEGETGMAYYGTPKQISVMNGNRAYESTLGRMESLAVESYKLLRQQQELGANYSSVFNTVWYAIQPLPLGQADTRRPFTLADGIFFPNYREGVPGMQPERIGPYCTTLNPGYDPALPLYQPWPMFDALRAAHLGTPWQSPTTSVPAAQPAKASAETFTLGYVPANAEGLARTLMRQGVKMIPWTADAKLMRLLVNAASAKELEAAAPAVRSVLAAGGTVWIWNITRAGAATVSRMLGRQVTAEARVASSFVRTESSPLVAGLDEASLYFSEDDDWQQMSDGLGGEFVQGAKTLLEACPVEWRTWNYQPEMLKTAALLRSQLERTSSRAVLVTSPVGQGQVILCNLSASLRSEHKAAVIKTLLQNDGIQILQASESGGCMTLGWQIKQALICGAFPAQSVPAAYDQPLPAGTPAAAADFNGQKWKIGKVATDGAFDFKQCGLSGPMENATAYVAIWIKSPKPLNDLLSEPNLPKLSFKYGCDDGCDVWLNGKRLARHERIGPLEPEMFQENPLLLNLGWNQLIIRVVQVAGEWKFAGKFSCDDTEFLSKLDFALAPSADETTGEGTGK